jgi:cell division protein FtsZ
LIDDVSMKGARGLLISITGGKDLTLYEVDEAATRIREEVDQEANIIVGATFDESLEGIIRVSVVATGIDYVATTGRLPNETRTAEPAHKLRVDTQRIAAERAEPQPQPQARQAPPQAPRPSFEQAATAAVAAALASPEDVTIRPITPKPSLFVEPVMAEPSPQEMPAAFIPPQPEIAGRAPRMPRVDELPVPAQNQIRAQRGEVEETGPEKQRMTLLQRLAQVGLGRRDDSEAHEQHTEAERPQLPPLPQRQPVRMPDPVSEYAKRPPAPAPQGLDIHGRQALPVHKPVDDDQLEIPAFLRRQAN